MAGREAGEEQGHAGTAGRTRDRQQKWETARKQHVNGRVLQCFLVPRMALKAGRTLTGGSSREHHDGAQCKWFTWVAVCIFEESLNVKAVGPFGSL